MPDVHCSLTSREIEALAMGDADAWAEVMYEQGIEQPEFEALRFERWYWNDLHPEELPYRRLY